MDIVIRDLKKKNEEVIKQLTDINSTTLRTDNKMIWFNYVQQHKKKLNNLLKYFIKLQDDYDAKSYFVTLANFEDIRKTLVHIDSKDTSIKGSQMVLRCISVILQNIAKVLGAITKQLADICKAIDNINIYQEMVKSKEIDKVPLEAGKILCTKLAPMIEKEGVRSINKFYLRLLGTSADNVYNKIFDVTLVTGREDELNNRGLKLSLRNLQKKII